MPPEGGAILKVAPPAGWRLSFAWLIFEMGVKPIFLVNEVNRTEQQIQELLGVAAAAFGCVIWGVEYLSAGKRARLCIYIDKPGGVSIEDCERVSQEAGDVLDLEGLIERGYDLEVSSPGLDRILFNTEQYAGSVGETLDVRLNFPLDGRKRFVGRLAGVLDAQVLLDVDGADYALPIANVQRARVVPCFD